MTIDKRSAEDLAKADAQNANHQATQSDFVKGAQTANQSYQDSEDAAANRTSHGWEPMPTDPHDPYKD